MPCRDHVDDSGHEIAKLRKEKNYWMFRFIGAKLELNLTSDPGKMVSIVCKELTQLARGTNGKVSLPILQKALIEYGFSKDETCEISKWWANHHGRELTEIKEMIATAQKAVSILDVGTFNKVMGALEADKDYMTIIEGDDKLRETVCKLFGLRDQLSDMVKNFQL